MTSHAGWPPDEHLMMDKGPVGAARHVRGRAGLHNYLLGGYGDDTIFGGDDGDVIWGDSTPAAGPPPDGGHSRRRRTNVIYANDTVNYVWTGCEPSRPSSTRTRAGA